MEPLTEVHENETLPAATEAPLAGLDRLGAPGDVHWLPATLKLVEDELMLPQALTAWTNQLVVPLETLMVHEVEGV